MIIIGGHDEYRDKDEEEQVVISRWARRKVVSQFDEEYLDGSRSFIFSWNETHREIHEEALKHYLDPSKKEQKFQYVPKPRAETKPTQDKVWLMFFFPLILNLLCFCHGGWKSLVKFGNKYSEFLPKEKAICLYLEIWQRTSFYICELEQITPFNYFSTL